MRLQTVHIQKVSVRYSRWHMIDVDIIQDIAGGSPFHEIASVIPKHFFLNRKFRNHNVEQLVCIFHTFQSSHFLLDHYGQGRI